MELFDSNKCKLLATSIIIGIIGFLVKLVYRPFILHNRIDDFSIHGFLPTFLYVAGICMFIAFLVRKRQVIAMMFGALGALVYEAEQIWTNRTFDFYDVSMVFAGFGVSVLILRILTKKSGNVQHEQL